MNYEESLQFIYEKLPMYHKIGSAAYKPGLQNIEALCSHLGNPQSKFKSIHVAGTNGKGSTSHMMASLLQCAQFKTGLFTSPHLKNFTERIRINGKEVETNFVSRFITTHKEIIEEIKPSFFEITTIMAFQYFAEANVDWAVIEVGLGGRLDSTNIILPQLSIITSISYDHQDLLGNTLAEIAFEKAGIIKPNVPVVISESQNEIKHVFLDKAKAENAPIYFTDEIKIEDKGLENEYRIINVKVKDEEKLTYVKCGLQGGYQLNNIKGVIKAKKVLESQGVSIGNENLIKSLLEAKEITGLKGRWQILGRKPLVICDTGHNEGGIKAIISQLKATKHEKLIMVLGFVKEKELNKILMLLPIEAHYIFTQPNIERALPAADLAQKAAQYGILGETIIGVNDAIHRAKTIATENDLIFVGGSNFVVAEINDL